MSKDKKKEGASKPRNAITITVTKEQHKQLEEERQQRGGDEKGVKIAHVARDKFVRGLKSNNEK